jgi:hypothetical protein
MQQTIEYRGFILVSGLSRDGWRVALHTRTRFGTLAEVKQDVDAFIAGTLPDRKGNGF